MQSLGGGEDSQGTSEQKSQRRTHVKSTQCMLKSYCQKQLHSCIRANHMACTRGAEAIWGQERECGSTLFSTQEKKIKVFHVGGNSLCRVSPGQEMEINSPSPLWHLAGFPRAALLGFPRICARTSRLNSALTCLHGLEGLHAGCRRKQPSAPAAFLGDRAKAP